LLGFVEKEDAAGESVLEIAQRSRSQAVIGCGCIVEFISGFSVAGEAGRDGRDLPEIPCKL